MKTFTADKVHMHGMQDKRWTIKQRIGQFRGVAKMYETDKQINAKDLKEKSMRQWQDIRQLRDEITSLRDQYSNFCQGDPKFIANTIMISDDKSLAKTYKNMPPNKLLEAIHQFNFFKRKKLDLIYFEKKGKMEKFELLQARIGKLKDNLIFKTDSKLPTEIKAQTVANNIQVAIAKKNAALAIRIIYSDFLNIMRKDNIYHHVVLDSLKEDCKHQGKCVTNATRMGQLAVEYLDDRKYEFNCVKQNIQTNMKIREKNLRTAGKQLERIKTSLGALIVKDESGVAIDEPPEEPLLQESVKSEEMILGDLEVIVSQLQEGINVSSYDQIIPRLVFQRFQKVFLKLHLRNLNIKHKETLHNLQEALHKLQDLTDNSDQSTDIYIEETQRFNNYIKQEKDQQNRIKNEFKRKGKCYIYVQTFLQNLIHMLRNCENTNTPRGYIVTIGLYPKATTDNVDDMITTLNTKIKVLLQAIQDQEVSAGDEISVYYHKHAINALDCAFKDGSDIEADFLDYEHEDPAVPTHKQIKLLSRKIVKSQVSEFDVPLPKK